MGNQSEIFIGDRESDKPEDILNWLTVDEACQKTKKERIKLCRKIWDLPV
jgi:hypothetical protein